MFCQIRTISFDAAAAAAAGGAEDRCTDCIKKLLDVPDGFGENSFHWPGVTIDFDRWSAGSGGYSFLTSALPLDREHLRL